MTEYFYTYLDEFAVLHHGQVIAESVDNAKNNIIKKFGDTIAVEVWQASKNCKGAAHLWPFGDKFYLSRLRSTNTQLIYMLGSLEYWSRIFFFGMAVLSFYSEEFLSFLFLVTLFFSTFTFSTEIAIFKDCIKYKKRFFHKRKTKEIDIQNSTEVLFQGKEFISDSGNKQQYYFIYLKKETGNILVFGNHRMGFTKQMAEKISSFLQLPLIFCEETFEG